jgi:hypothetical protein
MADERREFWEKKLTENQHILDMIDSGHFTAGDGSVMDAETIAEMRAWAMRRVAECVARIDERAHRGDHI